MWGIINNENVSRDRPRHCKDVFFTIVRLLLEMNQGHRGSFAFGWLVNWKD